MKVKCSNCFGSGKKYSGSPDGDKGCRFCGGTGERYITSEEARDILLQKQIKDAGL